MSETRALRLLAEDVEDLKVISAALQDAVVKIGDIVFEPGARRLTLALNRFRWENGVKRPERVRAGLQLGGVLNVQSRKLRRDAKGAVVSLLDVTFEPSEAPENPGGAVVLRFAGDADLRATVELLDVALADVSDPWPARRAPVHEA
jgi:hypothetical protein